MRSSPPLIGRARSIVIAYGNGREARALRAKLAKEAEETQARLRREFYERQARREAA